MRTTTTAATTVQNPSVSELHMVKAKHSKKDRSAKDRSQSMHKSCYYWRAMPSHPKKDCSTRDTKFYQCRKKGHFKGSCRSKKEEKELGRTKDVRKMQKSATVHKLKA